MVRQSEDTKQSKYVIRIICEGEKTEPLFFTSLCDRLIDESYEMNHWDVKTIPQPDIPEEKPSVSDRGWYKTKNRKTKGKEPKQKRELTGQPPLNWVHLSRKKLKEGVDEAWAVFDKDEHPARKAAFEEAERVVDGKIVHIAFSSRSFEYYLLLHFEYLYHAFQATECGERINGKKVYYDCMTEDAKDKACHGERCINGYARLKEYWKESKTSQSTFPLVEKRLRVGIINANKLRTQSSLTENCPIYDRNPYTDVDRLVCRLIRTQIIPYGELCILQNFGDELHFKISNNVMVVCNRSSHKVIMPDGLLKRYSRKSNICENLNERVILSVNESKSWELNLDDSEVVLIERSAVHPEYIFLSD